MTAAAIAFGSAVALAYLIGWTARGRYERRWWRARRGGYVRRVPMASVHPREPKP